MACYLICAGTATPTAGVRVKIGFAIDVNERRRDLQAAHWDTLYGVRVWVDGNRSTETWIQNQFAHLRIARDWFWFDPAMLTIEPPDVGELPGSGAAAEIIDILGGPSIVSKALGLPAMTVGNWRLRNSIPARHHHAILGMSAGKVTADQIVWAHAELATSVSEAI